MTTEQITALSIITIAFIGIMLLIYCSNNYSLNRIKNKTVGNGQHGTARFATKMQIKKTYREVEFDALNWRKGVNIPTIQGTVVGCKTKGKQTIALVDEGDVLKRILKASIQLENGTIITPTKGTPQGGIISPLLANIVLNELDRWVESQWQNNPVLKNYKMQYSKNGNPSKGHGYRAMKTTQLKEMHIVRYADDFRIFCSSRENAMKIMTAATLWLKERLRLDVSPYKTRVVNLKKQYSEFLGIKMRLKQKGKKMVVQSHVCDKAMKRIQIEACQKIKEIHRPRDGKTECQTIMAYNAFVMGIHNYYQIATDVSLDFAKISYHVRKVIKHLGRRVKYKPKMDTGGAIVKRYGGSSFLCWVSNKPVAPISYVKTVAPMGKRQSIQKYTSEGRREIHDNLGINVRILRELSHKPVNEQNTEFADNRLSLYCGQYGKCSVTGQVFENSSEIHCHHKIPKKNGGKDNYGNLTLILDKVHLLIHAVECEIISHYLSILNLDMKQLKNLNKLRSEVGNTPITV